MDLQGPIGPRVHYAMPLPKRAATKTGYAGADPCKSDATSARSRSSKVSKMPGMMVWLQILAE